MATTVTTQAMMAPPQQVVTQVPANVVHVAPEAPHPATAHKKSFTTVGIIQVSVGVLSFILGCVAMGLYGTYFYGVYGGYGLWSGAWYITSGALAIATGVRPTSCNVIAGLVISILACLTAFSVGIAEAAIAAAWRCFGLYNCSSANSAFIGVHGTLAFLAFCEFITAIVHSAYCCSGTCGSANQQGRVVTTTTYMNVPVIQSQMPMQQAYVQQQYYPPQQQQGFQTQQQQAFQAQQLGMNPGYSTQSQQTPPPRYQQEEQKQPM